MLRVARELIAGVPVRALERMNPEVMAAILPRVYPQMLDEVYAHQDAGRPTFIVSAAGSGVVEPLAAVLGMDGGVGTRYGVGDDGALTGRFDGPFVYGEGKVEAMKAYAAEHDIDLAASYAYSDAASDLPMLRAVGHPVAVNPDPALARGRPRGGLAGNALRAPRPPPGRRRGHPAGDDRRLRRLPHRRPPQAAPPPLPGAPVALLPLTADGLSRMP